MKKKTPDLRVGIFVVICLTLLGALVLNFSKGITLLHPSFTIKLHTSNVAGIKRMASVLVAGVPVGNVLSSELTPDGKGVILTLRMNKKFVIRKDATFVIEQAGFLGDQFVAIYPGANKGEIIQDGEEVKCQEPFNLQEVARSAAGFILRLDDTAKRLNEAIARIDRVVLTEQNMTNLASAITQFHEVIGQVSETVAKADNLLGTNAVPIRMAVSNLVDFSEGLKKTGSDLNEMVKTNGAAVSTVMKNVQDSSADLKSIMSRLKSGQGVAGSLLGDSQLQTNINALTLNLSIISSNLTLTSSNLNRKGLWGILWESKEPAASPRAAKPAYTGRDPMRK